MIIIDQFWFIYIPILLLVIALIIRYMKISKFSKAEKKNEYMRISECVRSL